MQIAALAGSVGQLYGSARSGTVGTAAPAAETPREPYLSPVFRFDKQARVAVFRFRDAETGDVKQQWPSEKVVKLYRNGSQPSETSPPAGQNGSSEDSTSEPASVGTGSSEAASQPSTGGSGGDRVRLTA
jgi:hypothetical protein